MNSKIAICISGELRYFDHALVINGFSNFINPVNADVFVSTWDHFGKSMNHGYTNPSDIQKSENNMESSILNLYNNVKKLKVENYNGWYESLDSSIKSTVYFGPFDKKTINSYSQLYKIYSCNELKREYEKECEIEYDITIRLRPDNLFISSLQLDGLKDDTVYNINMGNTHYPHRIYDIFFYGKNNAMNIVSDSFINFTDLLNNRSFNNGLDRRDACRILFLQCCLNNINVESCEKRHTDIFRGQSYEEYMSLMRGWGNI